MSQLLNKANDISLYLYISVDEDVCRLFKVFYRCKPRQYFDDIRVLYNCVMRPYIKDANGHPASPINGVCVCVLWGWSVK